MSISGFDPYPPCGAQTIDCGSRLLNPFQDPDRHAPICYVLSCMAWSEPWGKLHEAARVHLPSRRRGGSLAARGTRAAAGDAGDRVSLPWYAGGGGGYL